MSTSASVYLHRRHLLAGLVAALAPLAVARHAIGQQANPTAITEGDCTDEPSVKMLFDWRQGLPVYESVADAGPQIDWIPSELPVPMLPYLIPPDWRAVDGYTDAIDSDGVPQWTAQSPDVPWLFLARCLSEDSSAVFEYISGNIQGEPLTPEQVTTIARASLLGPDPKLTSVCTIDASTDPLAPSYFAVDRHKDSLLLTSVTALGLPDFYLPATTVSITSIYGPRKEMEDLMHDVFLRILFQFLGGGSGDPTPTPTSTL